jgi:predicted outer membrane repeat protein
MKLNVRHFLFCLVYLTFKVSTMPMEAQTIRFVATTGDDLGGTNTCINPETPCRSIVRALSAASNGDTIQLAAGIFSEPISLGKSVLLRGAGTAATIMQAHTQPETADSRVITITGSIEVEIADLTIRHGNAGGFFPDNAGGGLYNSGASLVLTNVHFNDNTAINGGGMYNQSGSASLTNVTFNRNKGTWGGGMANFNSSPLLTNVTFSENSAGEDEGGGMYNSNGSSPILINVTFENNNARYGGGMQNASGSSPELHNVTFMNNSAGFNGGGISNIDNSSPKLNNVTFSGNRAGHGGAIFNINKSSPTLNDVFFIGNVALGGHGGGMVNFDNSSPNLNNVTLIENSALQGGGMINSGESAPVLTNVSFIGNRAKDYGGGVVNFSGSDPILIKVNFIDNSCFDGPGGGMHNGESSPTLIDVSFTGNTSKLGGGGMSISNNSSARLTRVNFSGNSTENNGGGIRIVDGAPTLVNVIFNGNSAGSGGGIFTTSDDPPTLINVTLSGNSSVSQGGAIVNSGSMILNNVIIWNNRVNGNTTTPSASISSSTPETTLISYSLIANSGASGIGWNDAIGTDGGNNFDIDPLFITMPDPSQAPTLAGNLRLQSDSPAIDAGDPDIEHSLFIMNDEDIPLDIDGNPRIFNGRIDMGAYEYHEPATYAELSDELPATIELYQNYPNPFNPSTIISYSLPEQMHVELAAFDMLGRKVAVLVDTQQAAGKYDVLFSGDNLPSGIYLYRLRTPTTVRNMKMMLIR